MNLKTFLQPQTSSTQPQIWLVRVVFRTRTAKKCTKMQNARAGREELSCSLNPLFCGVSVAVVPVLV